jgi:hypothetical protein
MEDPYPAVSAAAGRLPNKPVIHREEGSAVRLETSVAFRVGARFKRVLEVRLALGPRGPSEQSPNIRFVSGRRPPVSTS